MQTPNLKAVRAHRPSQNKGRAVGQVRPLKPERIRAISVRLKLAKYYRDLALLNPAIVRNASATDRFQKV